MILPECFTHFATTSTLPHYRPLIDKQRPFLQLPDEQHTKFQHACQHTGIDSWRPLSHQGSSNYLFRTEHARRLLRINASPERAVGVCRNREASIMQLLQSQTWMVEVIENQPAAGWCHLRDYGDQPEAAVNTAAKRQLLGIITQLQKTPVTATDLNFEFSAIWSIYEQIITDNQASPDKQQACIALSNELHKTIDLQQQLPATPKVLGHQDLHLGNLTLHGAQLILLDWEYAGICQPWLDAAGLISQFDFTPEEVNQLPAFQHLNTQSFISAVDTAQKFNNQLEVLWLQAREISGIEE